jgi:hypothetical protein
MNAESIARKDLIDSLLSGWSMVRSHPGAFMDLLVTICFLTGCIVSVSGSLIGLL